MIWLYAAEVALVVTCLALVPRMKRAGEREWHRYRTIQQIQAVIDRVAPAIREVGRQMGLLGPAVARASKAIRQASVAMGIEREEN